MGYLVAREWVEGRSYSFIHSVFSRLCWSSPWVFSAHTWENLCAHFTHGERGRHKSQIASLDRNLVCAAAGIKIGDFRFPNLYLHGPVFPHHAFRVSSALQRTVSLRLLLRSRMGPEYCISLININKDWIYYCIPYLYRNVMGSLLCKLEN